MAFLSLRSRERTTRHPESLFAFSAASTISSSFLPVAGPSNGTKRQWANGMAVAQFSCRFVCLHDIKETRFREIMAAHAAAWRKHLEAFFERARPANGFTPCRAARLVDAILVGFDTNTLFDQGCT